MSRWQAAAPWSWWRWESAWEGQWGSGDWGAEHPAFSSHEEWCYTPSPATYSCYAEADQGISWQQAEPEGNFQQGAGVPAEDEAADVQGGAGAGSVQPRRRRPAKEAGDRTKGQGRHWCHIWLHQPRDHPEIRLVPMVIGSKGCNTKEIHNASGCKVRVRGKGSGHLEVEGKKEAPVPLMVAVTADRMDPKGFKTAITMTLARLKIMADKFGEICRTGGLQVPQLPLFSIGEFNEGAQNVIQESLNEAGVTWQGEITTTNASPANDGEDPEGELPQLIQRAVENFLNAADKDD